MNAEKQGLVEKALVAKKEAILAIKTMESGVARVLASFNGTIIPQLLKTPVSIACAQVIKYDIFELQINLCIKTNRGEISYPVGRVFRPFPVPDEEEIVRMLDCELTTSLQNSCSPLMTAIANLQIDEDKAKKAIKLAFPN